MPREEHVCADTLSKLSAGQPMKGTWIESLQEKARPKRFSPQNLEMIGLNQLRISF